MSSLQGLGTVWTVILHWGGHDTCAAVTILC